MSLALVAFTDAITGTAIDINPADVNIDACQAVPTSQLPQGVSNATRIWVRGVVHVVTGTLAATITALTTGAALVPAVRVAADGTTLTKNSGVSATGTTGTGVYTVDLASAAVAGSILMQVTCETAALYATAVQTSITRITVHVYDATGAAADGIFDLLVFPGLA